MDVRMGMVVACALAAIACGPGGGGSSCVVPASYSLGLAVVPQSESEWCWAAVGQMVMDAIGSTPSQCQQASDKFGATCCPTPMDPDCNQSGYPEFDRYHGYSPDVTATGVALTWDALTNQIGCGHQPVAFAVVFDSDGGHMMVAHGYYVDAAGERHVQVNDPEPMGTGMADDYTYDEYVAGNGYSHDRDYYGF